MPPLNNLRLATFAGLIAGGYSPVSAAKAAGYRNMRASRAATRLAPPPAAPAPEPPPLPARPKAPRAAEKPQAQAGPPARPPPPPMMTEEEWLAEFGPMLRARAAARA